MNVATRLKCPATQAPLSKDKVAVREAILHKPVLPTIARLALPTIEVNW